MGKVKLVYKGSDSISNEDAQKIIIRALEKLTDVFENDATNYLLLMMFTSLEIFVPRESKDLSKFVDNSPIFTRKFCDLLQERDDAAGALNQLLNLDNPNFANYEKKIRKLFNALQKGELVVQEIIQPPLKQNLEDNAPPRRHLGVTIPQQQQADECDQGRNLSYIG